MSEAILFKTERPISGATIRVDVSSASNPENKEAIIESAIPNGVRPFSIKMNSNSEGRQAFLFSLQLPGKYYFTIENKKTPFEVYATENLSFMTDFGLTVFLIITLLGGIILWAKKAKKRARSKDGSF